MKFITLVIKALSVLFACIFVFVSGVYITIEMLRIIV